MGEKINVKSRLELMTALIALFLAGTSFIVWGVRELRGAKIEIYPGDYIVLFADAFQPGDVIARLSAKMNYVNVSSPGYNAAIKNEFIEFDFNGIKYRQVGHSEVYTNSQKYPPECGTENPKNPSLNKYMQRKRELENGDLIFNCNGPNKALIAKRINRPINQVLLGGSGTSHEMLFVPQKIKCVDENKSKCKKASKYLRWDTLIEKSKKGDKITFTSGIELYNDERVLAKPCTIIIDTPDIVFLKNSGWQMFNERCE